MPYCDLDPGVLLVFLKNLINMSIIVSELQPPQVDTKPLCYIRLSMEDEDVSLNQKEESNSVSSQRELLESFIGNHSELKDTKVQEYCDDGFTGTKFAGVR